jgi:hypothetical protein
MIGCCLVVPVLPVMELPGCLPVLRVARVEEEVEVEVEVVEFEDGERSGRGGINREGVLGGTGQVRTAPRGCWLEGCARVWAGLHGCSGDVYRV